MNLIRAVVLLSILLFNGSVRADVVINEIMYHAPDDLDELQFVELHNTGDQAVDLSGWRFNRGIRFQFPDSARIEANGFVVLCKNPQLFKKFYGIDAGGTFDGSLSHSEMRLELANANKKVVDAVHYRSRGAWPVAADGYSSSLERICPTAPGNAAENWAAAPFPASTRPSGTPGKKNANYAPHLPPAVSKVTYSPKHAGPDQDVKVEADVRSAVELKTVELRFRLARSGVESEEQALPMTKGAGNRYGASIPAQAAGQIIRFRVRAVDAKGGERFFPGENDVRTAYSVYVHDKFEPSKLPLGFIINVGQAEMHASQRGNAIGNILGGLFGRPGSSPRGRSAFVYVNPKTAVPELFDFINITPRKAGRKIHLHKDHALAGMTTINLIYEELDRFVLAEPLAYEVYRKAGNAALRTDFVRTWLDGKPIGYQLLIEQPNKAFLRRLKFKGEGNLYKCVWYGNDLISQHEKKSNIHKGHEDLVQLVAELKRTQGDAQWEVIKKNFDVEQVINYFAVNMVLSHWDGYFNNYFTYHDTGGSGKWTMYPWDQDKTWGFHDGIRGYDVFVDMPVTMGMEGDVPPGTKRGQPTPNWFGFNSIWWRPGGAFSRPLLANPQFRKHFLARTREIIDTVYTEEVFFPIIQALGERLEVDVKLRAELHKQDPKQAVAHLQRNLDALRNHLTKRRVFLLAQDEIKSAGKFDRTLLK